MSLFNCRRFIKFTVIISTAFLLTGCFRPLHGPTRSGEPMANVLGSIDVPMWKLPGDKEYLSHVIRTDLVSELSGYGSYKDVPKRYRLELSYSERSNTAHIDQVTSRADSSVITGTLNLKLLEGSTVKYTGRVQASVSFERTPQRFATIRAMRDAYTRLGKTLATQAKTSLSLHFATE